MPAQHVHVRDQLLEVALVDRLKLRKIVPALGPEHGRVCGEIVLLKKLGDGGGWYWRDGERGAVDLSEGCRPNCRKLQLSTSVDQVYMRVTLDGGTAKGIQLYRVYRYTGIQWSTVYSGIHSPSEMGPPQMGPPQMGPP